MNPRKANLSNRIKILNFIINLGGITGKCFGSCFFAFEREFLFRDDLGTDNFQGLPEVGNGFEGSPEFV